MSREPGFRRMILRIPSSARSTYLQEKVQPHLKKLNWTTETLERDTKIFWIAVNRLWKYKPTLFDETLLWAAKTNLHPLAFVKTVHTILNERRREIKTRPVARPPEMEEGSFRE